MENMAGLSGRWIDKTVLVTGHTGFKGVWLCGLLAHLGARVTGFSLPPEFDLYTKTSLTVGAGIEQYFGDINDYESVAKVIQSRKFDAIFHLAAQPLVIRSYKEPISTWATNVMGTLHVLEAVRLSQTGCRLVVVTTDKVYADTETSDGYNEQDRLGGHNPYSASKAACELAVESYRKSFFENNKQGAGNRLVSARAGNVIGGGDWADFRLIPDVARAKVAGEELVLRNPDAVRPWQHVLDPLLGYLRYAEYLDCNSLPEAPSLNFGPDSNSQKTVRDVVEKADELWPLNFRIEPSEPILHEAAKLTLDSRRARELLGWRPRFDFADAVGATIEFYLRENDGEDPSEIMNEQIRMVLK